MIVGVYGYHDSGKTTVLESTIQELVNRGFSVASVKHSPNSEAFDVEGKDSWRHWKAGSDPVVLQGKGTTLLLKRPEISLERAVDLLSREFHPEVIIIEGYKDGSYPKVAIGDIEPTEGTVLVNPSHDEMIEYISDQVSFERIRARLPGLDCAKCGMSCDELAREIANGTLTIETCVELPARHVEISVGGRQLPVGAFVAEITDSTIRGLLSSLKGYSEDGDVEIRLKRPGRATRNDEHDSG